MALLDIGRMVFAYSWQRWKEETEPTEESFKNLTYLPKSRSCPNYTIVGTHFHREREGYRRELPKRSREPYCHSNGPQHRRGTVYSFPLVSLHYLLQLVYGPMFIVESISRVILNLGATWNAMRSNSIDS